MINVPQMTALFTRMTPPQRKEYAQMHKNDPYTISLLMGIDAQEKALRSAMQGAAQGQPPSKPTVVDQELAQMGGQSQAMPEDSGIGALPQQPMGKAMAGGGIVAFKDEGLVKGVYSGEGGQYSADPLTAEEMGQTDTFGPLRRFGAWAGRNVERDPVTGEVVPKASADATPATAVSAVNPTDARLAASTQMTPMVAPAAAAPTASPLSTLAPRAPFAAAPAAGLSFIEQQKKNLAAMGPEVNPEQKAMEDLIKERNRSAELGKTEFETDVKARADQFKGREERIGKRELALGKEKDTNTGMAFLQAGLAMMQARGPGLAAIAQGAGVGAKQYASGLKDLKAAQEKLDEARDKTDELKQNQSMMDAKERRGLSKDIRDASLTGQQYMIDARAKIHGEKRAEALAATASDITVQQAALDRQNRIAVAGMPGDQQKMLTALGGKGGLEAGLTKMQEIQADKTGAVYAKLYSDRVIEAQKASVEPPTPAKFAADMRGLAAALNPGKVPGAVDATGASRS